jgi:hypothetical protein
MAGWRQAVELAMTMRRLEVWQGLRAREPRRRVEWNGHKCCSATVRIRRSLRWGNEAWRSSTGGYFCNSSRRSASSPRWIVYGFTFRTVDARG